MLQLAGGIGLGMDVGDLLQLQRTLHAGGIVEIAADEEDGVVVEEARGKMLDLALLLEYPCGFVGQALQLGDERGVIFGRDGAALIGHVDAQL